MSFDLGNWWQQLRCDLCDGEEDEGRIDLNLPPDYLDDHDGLPDDFWDEPPEPSEDDFDLGDLIPDPHPYLEFPDGGFIFGIEGTF